MIIRDEKLCDEAFKLLSELSDEVIEKIYVKATKDAKALDRNANVDDVVVVAQSLIINFIYVLIFKFSKVAAVMDKVGGRNEE